MVMHDPIFRDLLPHLQTFSQKRGGHANTSAIEAAVLHNSNCDLQGMALKWGKPGVQHMSARSIPRHVSPMTHKRALVHHTTGFPA